MKTFTKLIAVVAMGMLVFAGSAGATGYGKQKVVYHVNFDNPKQQTGALRNIQNHINAVGKENLDLRVVMHGHGLSMILYPEALGHTKAFKTANADPQRQAAIDNLKMQGIQFKICANTIKGRNVQPLDDLHGFEQADVVPSGVAELAHLQAQGFTYVKP
jgi:intracellular sulfur oxidation DsrE/DsrF family protein